LSTAAYLNERRIALNRVLEQRGVADQQSSPVAANVRKLEMLAQKRGTAFRNLAHLRIMLARKLQELLQVGLVSPALHWDVVEPGPQGGIEELLPFVAHVEHWSNQKNAIKSYLAANKPWRKM